MRISYAHTIVTLTVLAALLTASTSRADRREERVPPAAAPSPVEAPFARVYLAIRGCTSCSHCRTAIRQMVRAKADGGQTRLVADQVEVRYATPRPIPLREVIRSLADHRLHDLSLVDVLFEAQGAVEVGRTGEGTFTLTSTGQTFRLSIDRAVPRPADRSTVRLTAMVDGWRGKGDLSLVARTIRAVN